MSCRSIGLLFCMFTAVSLATLYRDPDSTTESSTMETRAVDLGDLLDDGEDATVTLVAGETRLVAHRTVLMDRSPVFRAMFQNYTVQASGGEVTVQDVEGPVLRKLVSYLYTLRLPQLPDIDMVTQLLPAANKYGVAGLKAACEQQLSVEAAAAAVRHSCTDLSKAAANLIKANLQVMAAAVLNQPKDMGEVSPLLADPLAETSPPPPADSGTCHQPSTQLHSETPASAAPATAAAFHIPPPDDAYVSDLRGLSKSVKHKRLIEAAGDGAVLEVEALLAAGAGVAARDEMKRTPLHLAAAEGNVEVARRLLAWGAPVDARDNEEWTPLHCAAGVGHATMVRLLLAASADHSARGSSGWTPLHWAADRGKVLVAAALLEAGADKGATSISGKTPLDLARKKKYQQLVELLTRT